MKKVQIITGVCIGGIALVTVVYLTYVQLSKSSRNTEDTRREIGGITKGGIYSVIEDNDSINSRTRATFTLTCPPCPEQPPTGDSSPSHPEIEAAAKSQASQRLSVFPSVAPDLDTVPRAQGYLVSGATVKMFSGDATREFPKDSFKFSGYTSSSSGHVSTKPSPQCERWAVMTTIFEVSDAVRRQVRLRNWCLVVVADKRSPKTYNTGWMPGEGNEAVVYLTPDDQMAMKSEFADALPWNNFGRKNVGFLYAIMHGAKVIYDFDDDNLLKFWIPGAAPPGAPSLDAAIADNEEQSIDVLEPKDHNWPTYNPYPVLGAPTLPSWPRGLPLDDIKVPNCSNTPLHYVTLKARSIAVLQSLAEYEPDVDAIYRLTMPIPFFFNRPKEDKHLMVPKGTLTPYNAQATLHFRAGFFGLFLPITVAGRVSDIWRSYIAQRLFWDVGLQIGFIARPIVVQDRNVHTNVGDLAAEWDLYMKSKQLMTFVESWRGKGRTIVERTEELFAALYERQYIEIGDVELVQLWLQSLINAGYRFPEVIDAPTYSSSSYPELPKQSKSEEKCTTTKGYKFWTSDKHDNGWTSVLTSLGHNVIIAGVKQNNLAMSYSRARPGIKSYNRLSEVLLCNDKSLRLTEAKIKENFEFYRTDHEIETTDVFVCSNPSSQCELWMPFNKTIAILPSSRYNLGRCDAAEWERWTKHIRMLATMDDPNNIIGASSVYDQEYLRYYTGLNPLLLFHPTTLYTEDEAHTPTRNEILCISQINNTFIKKSLEQVKQINIVDVYQLYPHYQLSNLMAHRAIVFFPDSPVSYMLSEVYRLGIPLFIPSAKFLRSNKIMNKRTILGYCSNNKTTITAMKPDPKSTHPYNPNVEGGEDESYWLQFSDFYQWPHITYFDSMLDLERKLQSADFNTIHKHMLEEVQRTRNELSDIWCRTLKSVDTGRKVPTDYPTAIQQLYGVTRLQVD